MNAKRIMIVKSYELIVKEKHIVLNFLLHRMKLNLKLLKDVINISLPIYVNVDAIKTLR